jgi:hypothetical protein
MRNRISLSLGSLLLAAAQAAAGQTRTLIVEVETLSQLPNWQQQQQQLDGSGPTPPVENYAPAIWPVWFAFHDGSLDTFDVGSGASTELAQLAKEAYVRPLIARYASTGAVTSFIMNTPTGFGLDPLEAANPIARRVELDPSRHSYFSFLGKLVPSDDGFVGNDDPGRYRVFDADGRFTGPLVFEVWGEDVMDAGVRANDEVSVFTVHRTIDLNAGTPTADPITTHPGYRGSSRNAQRPAGILGVRSRFCAMTDPAGCYDLDRIRGDFTRPGYPLLRIRIAAGLDGSFSGTWFDPARSGEGFQLEVTDGVQPQLLVGWFTYAPDGSGRQMWLTGGGPIDFLDAVVPLFDTRGGRFGSLDNPGTVQTTPKGELRIGFAFCNQGRITFTPSDGSLPPVDYFIRRLTSAPRGTSQFCSRASLGVGRSVESWPY